MYQQCGTELENGVSARRMGCTISVGRQYHGLRCTTCVGCKFHEPSVRVRRQRGMYYHEKRSSKRQEESMPTKASHRK